MKLIVIAIVTMLVIMAINTYRITMVEMDLRHTVKELCK